MTDCFEAKTFLRHHRQLRALMLEHQAWFCLADVARLMGKHLDERATRKLDPDQHRTAWLSSSCQWSKQLMISESGLFAILVHHYVPENRALRQWLTHDVLPQLRHAPEQHLPCRTSMQWEGNSVGLMEWQCDYWVRLRDMPKVARHSKDRDNGRLWPRLMAWAIGFKARWPQLWR